MYPKLFDSKKIPLDDKQLLDEFAERRKAIDKFIENNKINIFTCPSCGFPTISERGGYEICVICFWEDDNQDDSCADEIWGGPNSNLSLTESRINIGRILKDLANSLNATLNKNPLDILQILSNHQMRMNKFDEDKMMMADKNDLIWQEWECKSNIVLTDLMIK